jgi:hypothetical protein
MRAAGRTREGERPAWSHSLPAGREAKVAGVFFVTVLSACQAAPRARFPDAQSALGQLERRTECSRAVQGEADLVASSALMSVRGKMLYMAQAKDRVRFDLYSDFGVTLSTLTSDGNKFALYSLEQKSFWYGPAKTCNLKRFTQVAVPPFALVELLRGRTPVLEHQSEASAIEYRRPIFSGGRYVVDITGAHEAHQRIELGIPTEDFDKPLSDQRVRLLSVRVKQGGDLLYRVALDDYRPARRAENAVTDHEAEMGILPPLPSGPPCSAEIPGTLVFTVPGGGYKLTIENREVVHNPGLSPSAFAQQVPQGVHAEFSDCTD